mmetsp:Transcript_10014/g.32154  ORF Transcript_10014/g.32154 Transcript_10014/m.32154 type:complete len:340 (+) Transcript_10014:721-1740(+)
MRPRYAPHQGPNRRDRRLRLGRQVPLGGRLPGRRRPPPDPARRRARPGDPRPGDERRQEAQGRRLRLGLRTQPLRLDRQSRPRPRHSRLRSPHQGHHRVSRLPALRRLRRRRPRHPSHPLIPTRRQAIRLATCDSLRLTSRLRTAQARPGLSSAGSRCLGRANDPLLPTGVCLSPPVSCPYPPVPRDALDSPRVCRTFRAPPRRGDPPLSFPFLSLAPARKCPRRRLPRCPPVDFRIKRRRRSDAQDAADSDPSRTHLATTQPHLLHLRSPLRVAALPGHTSLIHLGPAIPSSEKEAQPGAVEARAAQARPPWQPPVAVHAADVLEPRPFHVQFTCQLR